MREQGMHAYLLGGRIEIEFRRAVFLSDGVGALDGDRSIGIVVSKNSPADGGVVSNVNCRHKENNPYGDAFQNPENTLHALILQFRNFSR